MKVHVFNIEWDLVDEETGLEIDPKEEGLPKEDDLEVDVFGTDEDIENYIGECLSEYYGFCIKSFEWKRMNVEDQIKAVLCKYFEGNPEYDPNFSAQDAIDEIKELIGM